MCTSTTSIIIMQSSFALKIQASREAALASNRIVTFSKEDLTKISSFVESKAKIPYSWYQTDLRVGIDIPYVLTNKDLLKTTFQATKLTVQFPTETGIFHIELDLGSQIIPEKSKSIVHLNRIEIQMEKKIKNQLWPRLQQLSAPPDAEESHIPQYPTSSTKKKDWAKLEREIVNEAKKNKDDDEGANGLFKQIYAGASEETRRAMIKSLQTSGGTVLSTDWNDVKNKDYEGKDRPSPPKGQEWRKYG